MVFESVVADILNKFIGNYVENLDKNQLKIGIWGGDVVLTNLALKENAFDDLDLPLRLLYGSLGKLVLKIPWTNLYSEPVVALVEDLYLLICSKQATEYNEEKEIKYELQRKQAQLQELEEARKQKQEKDKPKPDQSFTEKLTAQIVNNIQITIANVHIRYEDKTTDDHPLAFGITLHHFDIYTTDINWVKSYMKEQLSKVYKVADLNSLSVYMNCNTTLFTSYDVQEYNSIFKSTIATNEVKPEKFSYAIGPISCLTQLQLNLNPQYDDPPFRIPKMLLNLEVQKLNIGIKRDQFQALMKFGDALNRMKIAAPYRKYRPHNIPYKGHYKEWWKFAITCVLECDVKRRSRNWSWEYIRQHRKLIQTYAQAYKELKLATKPTANLTETCCLCEQKLDMLNLVLVRNRVDLEIEKLKLAQDQQAQIKKSWFSGWWGGSKANEPEETENNLVKKFEAAMTPEEKEKLYAAIGYQENAVQLALPEDYEAIQMNFKLLSLEILIANEIKSIDIEDSKPSCNSILTLRLSTVTCSLCQRPAANAIKLNIGIKEFTITGFEKNNMIPTIVESQVPDEYNLLEILFETNPLDKKCSQRVNVLARPLLIVFDAETLLQLVSVFTTPSNVNLSRLEDAAASKLADLKERSTTGMQYLIDKHDILDLNIKFMPNIILIPHEGNYTQEKSSLVVISLGELSITSEPRGSYEPSDNSLFNNEDKMLYEVIKNAYDTLKIQIADVQVLVSKPEEKWTDVIQEKKLSSMYILRPTSLIITIALCVIPDDPRLPKTKVKMLIPSVKIRATEERIFEALTVMTSIPLPGNDLPEPAPLGKVASAMISASVMSLTRLLTDKDQQKKPEPPSNELVQYTDFDINFHLSDLSVIIYKQRAQINEEEIPNQDESHKNSDQVICEHLEDGYAGYYFYCREEMISLLIFQLDATVTKKTFELSANIGLDGITILHRFPGHNIIKVVDHPTPFCDLLKISYVNAVHDSPEFTTKYHSIEQSIDIKLSTLHFILHLQALQHLLLVADRYQKRLDKLFENKRDVPKDRIATAATDSIFTKVLDTIKEEGSEDFVDIEPQKIKKPTRSRSSRKTVDSIKIKLTANVDLISIELTCTKRKIAVLDIERFVAGAVVKSTYTQFECKLQDITLFDANPKSTYSWILSVMDEDALSCRVIIYDMQETSSYNSDDMQIHVKMGCCKIVYLNWFVSTVLEFLSHFQAAQQAISNASAAAAETARQTAVEAYQKAKRIKFNIDINAPVIDIPVSSKSNELITIDLGFLSITNHFYEVPVEGANTADNIVIDTMKLKLRDIRCYNSQKQYVSQDSDTSRLPYQKLPRDGLIRKALEEDEEKSQSTKYIIDQGSLILAPITFELEIKRNLSFHLHKNLPEIDVRACLRIIKINLFGSDYARLMAILNGNLSEGQTPAEKLIVTTEQNELIAVADIHQGAGTSKDVEGIGMVKSDSSVATKISKTQTKAVVTKTVTTSEDAKVDVQFVFYFYIEGINTVLADSINKELASFGLYHLTINGKQLVDQTLTASIILSDMRIDDVRPLHKDRSFITRFLEPKYKKSIEQIDEDKEKQTYMLDITAIIKQDEIFSEIRVSSFNLIISIDFLTSIAKFFEDSSKEQNINNQVNQPKKTSDVITKPSDSSKISTKSQLKSTTTATTTSQSPESSKKMHIVLHLEEPDIILVESMESKDTHAIIFNMEALFKLRTAGEKQLIFGEVKDLRMYMCEFAPEKRESTKHFIIHPCTVSLHGSTPNDMGLNLSLKVTNIVITISPAILELINKAVQTVTIKEEDITLDLENKIDEYKDDYWEEELFKEDDFWFIEVGQAIEALEMIDLKSEESVLPKPKPEVCIVEIPSIVIFFAAGIGYYTTPMLFIETKMGAEVHNWSSQMKISGNLNLSMKYYNQTLAVWEPLIEENEKTLQNGIQKYSPWELNFELEIIKNEVDNNQTESEPNESDTITKINVNSQDVLEITVSKSCLDLLQMLGAAFSQALDTKGLIKPEIMSSYVLENDTGFDLIIKFDKGSFAIHECHLPERKEEAQNQLIDELEIQKTNSVENNVDDNEMYQITSEDIKSCVIKNNGRIYLQKKELSSMTDDDYQDLLFIMVRGISKAISLPVSKAVERYFPLYRDTNQEAWGIVSEIKNEYGMTKINIHGVLRIKNHFTTSILVHQIRKDSRNDVIGEVLPNQTYNVPLHAIYSVPKELYFSLSGYKCSVQGIIWNECLTDMNFFRQIQCDPVETFEPFYLNVMREKTDIYFEMSSKHTLLSAYYTLHLRPPLYLRNSLPVEIQVSVAGCSVHHDGITEAIEANEQKMEKKQNNDETTITTIQKLNENQTTIAEDFLDYGEKKIQPGDILHLPTVKLTSKTGDARSNIAVKLVQYLEKDWICITEISSNYEEHEVWTFTAHDSDTNIEIELGVRFENRFGSLQLTIYSPFWMVNKTGLSLHYRTSSEPINVVYHSSNYIGPVMFSFHEHFFNKKRACIRAESGEWSEKIPLDVAGSSGVVECKTKDKTYQIGVHYHLTNNTYTKHITFLPYYVLINKTPFAIEVGDASQESCSWINIPKDECVPLWPTSDTSHLLCVRVEGHQTPPFNYNEVQCTLLVLHKKYGGINADVQVTESGVYITFTQYHPGDAPCLIVNHTDTDVKYWQKPDSKNSKQQNFKTTVVHSQHKVLYSWEDPARNQILCCSSNRAEDKDITEIEIGRDGVGQFKVGKEEHDIAYWVSFLDGAQRVLLLTNREAIAHEAESTSKLEKISQILEIDILGIGFSLINDINKVDILYLRIASSGVIWESRKRGKERFKQMKIAQCESIEAKYQEFLRDVQIGSSSNKKYHLDDTKQEINFNTMILMKTSTSEREIKRTFYPGLWLQWKTSPFQLQIHAKINRLQVDNQLYDCVFPVLCAPIPPPKSVAANQALKPFVECSVVQKITPYSSVKQFKYFSMLIQEFHVKVDLLFLNELLEIFSGEINDEEAAKKFKDDIDWVLQPLIDLVQTSAQQQVKHFFDYLHLGPIKIHVSFSMAGAEAKALPSILSTILQGVGVTLTDINDVVFRLAFFEREYQFFTQKQLISEIVTHYAGQAVKQLYVLVLGLDVLGNPYGLVVGFKKGVEDLFYEPFQGAIQGPGEFAEGLALGVKSLFGHTVGGAAGAVSKITGAMGKGLAALTFDKEYQMKRRQALSKKPANFQEGIARSGKGLVMGVVDGFTGVFSKPIAGAREEGVEGFFKGVGKGAVGLVARPTAGLVDFASGSLDAVKRATEGSLDIHRIRPPRFLHPDGHVQPYCYNDALGNKILKEIDKGKYAKTDIFEHLELLSDGKSILILSNHRVIVALKSDLFGVYNVQWTYRWNEISTIESANNEISIILHKTEKKFFSSIERQKRKTIAIPNGDRQDRIIKLMITLKQNDTK